MRANRPRAFTLIELLVVVAIILILVGIGVPMISAVMRGVNRARCAKNLSQLGQLITMNRVKTGQPGGSTTAGYPAGGRTPAAWSVAILGKSHTRGVLTCPEADEHSPTNPSTQPWAVSSYAYVGNLNPTYACTHCADGKHLWRLYWSGVDHTGGHQDGVRATDDGTFARANGYALSDNVAFDPSKAGAGEPADPTVPDHQDLGHFSPYRHVADRALRQVPDGLDDTSAARPLLMDIVVLSQRPAATGGGALAWEKAHLDVTNGDRDAGIFFANHCNTSASSKTDWGVNIYYTSASVQWKPWAELRFQVRAPHADGVMSHYYFY